MANKKITELPAATLPLTGTEPLELVQGGVNVQAPASALGGTSPDASPTTKGIAKLYTSTGSNTDGSMDQNSITSALAGKDAAGAAAAAQAASQPLDSDLTAIAALTPSNDDVIQRKGGVWTNRTMAQLGADLQQVNIGNLLYLYNNFI